ncbi:hypothetical protein GCM10022254_56610 [Actinomadura meridiana]|uniref:Endonuclease/exonuclease/phosphatase domain-containing protein n=1 Tax=Actinomadura meridiana TaxID=559626 RepID=A0ABP8CGP4_9ACTN
MRSARALIPLLSICASAAVVTAAAVGANIEGLPGGGGPAHADSAANRPGAAVTVTAMSWNVCGGARPGCPLGAAPGRLTKEIVQRMRATQVGGRTVTANAVLLQEVCEGNVRAFKKVGWLSSWSWAFAAPSKGPSCADGQGRLGVAIGTAARLVEPEHANLPAPAGKARIALCGDVPSWTTRVCVTRLEQPEDAKWRRRQADALAGLAGSGRVLFGGDLGAAPQNRAFDSLYKSYAECDQSGTSRSGARTRQNWTGAAVEKDDYLFINRSAAVSCSVPADRVRVSDHRPLSAVVRYR